MFTKGHVRDLRYDAADQRLYVADWRGGLEIWDLQTPHEPTRLSTTPIYYAGTDSDQPADGLALVGDTLYVNANEARVHALDVSNATSPVDLGIQAGPSWYYSYQRDTHDVAAAGDDLYVAGSGIARYQRQANGSLSKTGENVDLYDDVTSLGLGDGLVYAGVGKSFGVFDVSSPALPSVGSIPVAERLDDLAVSGNHVVAVNRDGLLVLDVSTPTQPQQIGSLALPGGFRVRLDGDVAYVASDAGGLQVVNLSDPASPSLLGSYDTVGTSWAVTVDGNHAYLGQGTAGLVITDISHPNDVQVEGRFRGGSAIESLRIGQHLYVADWYTHALRVLSVSNVSQPVEVGRLDDFNAVDLATDGTRLFSTSFSVETQLYTLHVFDITDPTAPQELATRTLTPHILELQYANGHLLALEFPDKGIHILDVTNPLNPFETAFYPVDWGEDIWIQGDFAYVTSFHEGLLVLNIADPGHPTLAGSVFEIYQFDQVAVSGALAFVTTGTTGEQHLRVYDVANPAHIEEIDRMPLPGNAWDLAAHANVAYVADGITGLQIIRIDRGNDGLIFADGFESGHALLWSTVSD